METRLSFQQQVRYERKKRSWSQRELAERLKVDIKTVVRWESGQSVPRPDAQQALCKLFETDAEKLGLLESHKNDTNSSPTESQEQEQVVRDVQSTVEPEDGAPYEPEEHIIDEERTNNTPRVDWDEVVHNSEFYGRVCERKKLTEWILDRDFQVIAVIGAGGVGKTTLSTRLARQIQAAFDCVFWRSLQNAPPLKNILKQCIPFISQQECTELPEDLNEQIELLISYCKEYRCLLIFDNVESIMQEGERAGKYRKGYEAYGKLLRRMGEARHQSCLLLTSREKPREVAHMEGKAEYVQSLNLTGVEAAEGQKILRHKGLPASLEDAELLVRHYAGNPLALSLVAEPIQSVLGGDVARFLQEGGTAFGDIHDLLEQQMQRLPSREQDILYWLAIEREAVSFEDLGNNLVDQTARAMLLETVASLSQRSMIEIRAPKRFTLQPVIMEYVTSRLVKQFSAAFDDEINGMAKVSKAWTNYALLKAKAKDYIREIQKRLILGPIAQQLLTNVGQKGIEQRLKQALALQQREYALQPGYLAGNVLNLFVHLQCDLRGLDLSALVIRQAYLQDIELREVNASHAHFIESVFTNTFGNILTVTFNASGELYAVGTATGEVLLFKAQDETLLLTCRAHTDAVWSVVFSPDGERLASGSDDQTVRLWDVNTGQCLKKLAGHKNRVRSIAFTPDGERLASGSEDNNIYLWDTHTGQQLACLKGHTDRVWSVAFSPDGSLLASASTDRTIRLWNSKTGALRKVLARHNNWVRTVAFHPDGKTLASGGDDLTIRLWNIDRGEQIQTLDGHTNHVWSIAFSPDGKLLASGSEDRTIRIWDVATRQCIDTLRGHANGIRTLAFSPINSRLVSGGEDQTIRTWNVETGQGLTTLRGYTNRIWSALFSPDGSILASCNENRKICLWDRESARRFKTLHDSKHGVRAIAFSPYGNLLASGGEDQTVRLWDVHRGRCLKILHGHQAWVRSIAFSPHGVIVASGSEDQTIRLWDTNTGQLLKTLREHNSWVRSIAFNADGTRLASGGDDAAICVWDVATGQVLRTMHEHMGRVRSVTFSPDGRMIASGSEDQIVRLWDIESGQCLKRLHGHTNWVRSVAFSPDGRTLASSSDDYTLRLWNVENGQCTVTLHGHTDRVRWVTFSPDGYMLASSSDDGSMQLWNIEAQNVHLARTLVSECPYEDLNITDVQGLTEAQKTALRMLGAREDA